ncbi:MAG TPA: MerR family transcriptional regulator [Stellaceae bacterium]|jgi:DNA-binding transcriptional MerR regulator|nr:MerR family transcriptional regulator [Stellaceae bacterium]
MSMVESFDPAARRAAKSAGAFRTISEVAEELDVPQHVLRFWESKFTQVRPLKRGGGRRYYRPEDVLLLRRIRQCLYQDGYTIKGVQRLLREGALKNMPIVGPVSDAGEKLAAPPAERVPAPAAAAAKPSPAKPDPNLPPLLAAIDRASADAASEMQSVVAEVVRELGELRDLLRRRER